jgi:uncharacterized membrane protein YkvA (DUF1232 family)
MVLSIDVFLDFIPSIGFLDNIFVMGIVMKNILEEIERFKAFKNL